jgi:hypothetical protein
MKNILEKLLARIVVVILFAIGSLSSYSANVTLGWDANTETNIGGYKIFAKAGTNITMLTTASNVTTVTFTNINYNQAYEFYASVTNTLGIESDYSVSIFYTKTPPSLLSPSIYYSKFSRDPLRTNAQWSVELRWSAITNASSYLVVNERLGPGSPIGVISSFSRTNLAFTYTLGSGEYRIYVQSSNEFGLSSRNSFVNSPSVPLPPVSLRVIE